MANTKEQQQPVGRTTGKPKVKVKGKNNWVLAYWNGTLVGFLSSGLCLVSLFMAYWVGMLLKPVGNFDRGTLLVVIACMGSAGSMVGVLGAYIAAKCAKRNRSYQLRYMVYSYIGWGIGMVIAFFTSGVCIYASSDFSKLFTPGINMNLYPNDSRTRASFDNMQTTLKCCGYVTYTEWFEVKFSVTVKPGEVAMPDSCCSKPTATCIREVSATELHKLQHWEPGCLEVAAKHYATLLWIFAAFLLLIAISEAFVVILFCTQVRRIEKPKPTELTQLIERNPDGTVRDTAEILKLKNELANIQSFLEPPKLSTSQLWFFGKKQASEMAVKDTK